jgi:hypothetical protein
MMMRRYQGGGLIMYAIGAVVVMALLAGAVIWVNHFIKVTWEDPAYTRGTDDQRAADSKVLDQVKTERDQWKQAERDREHELEQQSDRIKDANDALKALNETSARLIARNKSIIAAQNAKRPAFDAEQARDRQIVLSPQPEQPLADEIKAINAAVLDAFGLGKPAK